MKDYTIDDIQSLSFREGVRTRIQMYLGSDDIEGCYQAFKEIINNSTDEAIAGFGSEIEITYFEDTNGISIRDYGRGVPFGIRESGENVLVSIYTKSHTGGKFDNKVYANSSGLNGIGGSCVCLSSRKFQVISYRDKKCACAQFDNGELVNYEEANTTFKNGTLVTFIPDAEVFKNGDIKYSYERLCQEIKNISYLYKGITFKLYQANDKKILQEKTFKAKNGISDLIADYLVETGKKPVHNTIITSSVSDGTDEIEIAFQWTTARETDYVFTNGLRNPEGGTPLTGAKTSITRTMNNLLGETLTGELARTGLVYIINCKVATPSFANQTKTKINNANLRGLADKAFGEALKSFAQSNVKEFKLIEAFLTKELKAERAAEKARAAVLEQNADIEKELKKKVILAGKLIDCRHHDDTSELWLCEGKSAAGAIAKARDGDRIAVFGCRGKGLNVLKEADLERILKNEEYREIMIALGCGYGEKFNVKKLRYGKIVIASDADVDGHSIACLLLSFFYRFYPELLKQGRIYRADMPLYSVTSGKKRYYAYSDEELAKLPKGDIERNKGLGEMEPEDFRDTVFSKDGHYTQFTLEDGAQAEYFFDILMGNNIDERREYIFENVDWKGTI